jgi:hypothetical protein
MSNELNLLSYPRKVEELSHFYYELNEYRISVMSGSNKQLFSSIYGRSAWELLSDRANNRQLLWRIQFWVSSEGVDHRKVIFTPA